MVARAHRTPALTEARIRKALAAFWTRVEAVNVWANKEGWGIFNGCEIQRIDEDAKFDSDEAALEHVQRLAAMGQPHGSALHQEALELLKIAEGIHV
jgi:hypothetical protein